MKMPSRTALLAVVVTAVMMVPVVASAQTPGIGFGVKGGANSATLSNFPDFLNAKQLIGPTGGFFVSGAFTRNIGFQVEALYSVRGVKAEQGSDTVELKLTYVDVPVLVRFGALTGKKGVGAFVFTGPVIGVHVSAALVANGQDVPGFSDEGFRSYDVGWTIGAGVTFGVFGLDARYTLGLRTLDTTAPNPESIKNRAFSVMASVRFK